MKAFLPATAVILVLTMAAGPAFAHGNNYSLNVKWYHWCLLPAVPFIMLYDSIQRARDESVHVVRINGSPVKMKSIHERGDIRYGISVEEASIPVMGSMILFEKYQDMSYFRDGTFHRGQIKGTCSLSIAGNRLPLTGKLECYPGGIVKSGTIEGTAEFVYRGKTIPITGEIWFHPGGTPAGFVLARRSDLIVGSRPLPFASIVRLYENGSLQSGCPFRDITFVTRSGTYTAPGTGSGNEGLPVHFHADGSLMSCRARSGTIILQGREIRLQSNAFIALHPNGSLKEMYASEPITIHNRGVSTAVTFLVEFYMNGALKRGTLAGPADLLLNGTPVRIEGNSEVILRENGELFSAKNYNLLDWFYSTRFPKEPESGRSLLHFCFRDRYMGDVSAYGTAMPEHDLTLRIGTHIIELSAGSMHDVTHSFGNWIGSYYWLPFTTPGDFRKKRAEKILFINDMKIIVDGKGRECRAFEWVELK